MKRILLALAFATSISPSFAADTAPPAKLPTVEELQHQIAILREMYAAAVMQRNAWQAKASDLDVEADINAKFPVATTPPAK